METQEKSTMSDEAHADEEVVLAHLIHGTPIDPDTYRRVRVRAEKITERLRQQHGEMNIAVDLIRAIRDEE
jgi:hypothetical protein